ncbi:FxLYD domain-containing protein (plasmid) [Haloarcula sp. NS06]|uniref:FxLYD domain-containing protein n=1 Tax=Haloarcula sp. NS06 TaxID=3409688 RepID=UPI003DA6E1B6
MAESSDGGDGGGSGTTMTAEGAAEPPTDTATATEASTQAEESTPTETTTPAAVVDLNVEGVSTRQTEGSLYSGIVAEGSVTNAGNAPSGTVEATCDWFDGDGNYVASQPTFCETIGAGETWLPLFNPSMQVDDPSNLASAELAISGGQDPPSFNPEGIELIDSTLRASEEQALIRGTTANNRSNTVSYLEANAKFYNSDGSILTTNWTNVTDLAAGESWQFELDSLLTDRAGQVESGEILLTTESL